MPTAEDILRALGIGEGLDWEYKSARGGLPGSLWETYSAMANTDGGVIVLGVEQHGDEFSIAGLPDPARMKKNLAEYQLGRLRELLAGIEALLDQFRRRRLLFDSAGRIFSKMWAPGARELENGYLPLMQGSSSSIPAPLRARAEARDTNP